MIKKLALPIFVPLVLWLWVSLAVDYSLHSGLPPQGTGPSNSNVMYPAGALLALPFAAFLQLAIGLPSWWFLRRTVRRWKFVGTGLVAALVMSLMLSFIFKTPSLRETAFTALPYVCLIFVPPFLVGYFLSFRFRMRDEAEKMKDEPNKSITAQRASRVADC